MADSLTWLVRRMLSVTIVPMYGCSTASTSGTVLEARKTTLKSCSYKVTQIQRFHRAEEDNHDFRLVAVAAEVAHLGNEEGEHHVSREL